MTSGTRQPSSYVPAVPLTGIDTLATVPAHDPGPTYEEAPDDEGRRMEGLLARQARLLARWEASLTKRIRIYERVWGPGAED